MAEQGVRYRATISDYQEVFGSPTGKKVLHDLMKKHGVLERSYSDHCQFATAFNEGGRNAVLMIMKKLRIDLRELDAMYKEQESLQGDPDVIE